MFTRQHYVKIAGFIKDRRLGDCSEGPACDEHGPQTKANNQALDMVALDLAEMFEEDNPRFDRERFEKACGLRG